MLIQFEQLNDLLDFTDFVNNESDCDITISREQLQAEITDEDLDKIALEFPPEDWIRDFFKGEILDD